MSKEVFHEKFEVLEELIRRANDLVNPEDSLAYLQKKDLRDRLYGEKPACFLKLAKIGRDVSPYLLPMCNRSGMEDPKVISLSIKVIQKLMTDEKGQFDVNDLKTMLGKLQHRHNVFNKPIPKPPLAAARKGKVTRMFNNIKGHLTRGDLDKTGSL